MRKQLDLQKQARVGIGMQAPPPRILLRLVLARVFDQFDLVALTLAAHYAFVLFACFLVGTCPS